MPWGVPSKDVTYSFIGGEPYTMHHCYGVASDKHKGMVLKREISHIKNSIEFF